MVAFKRDLHHLFIGFDPRELNAFRVACWSAGAATKSVDLFIHGVFLDKLREQGLFRRPVHYRDGRLYDPISDACWSTEFAVSRFLVPFLGRRLGIRWALFTDCDVLFRRDLGDLFALAEGRYAVMCVQHDHKPREAVKMDGQAQTAYPRKNWSSVMLVNCAHPANDRLTLDMVNTLPGRDLHRFCWLADDEIGALPARWNHLVGVDPHDPDAAIAHLTLGTPDMPGYADQPFADEWRAALHASNQKGL